MASNVANTAAWDDLLAKREAGLTLGIQPIIKADSGEYEDVPEPADQGNALIRTHSSVKLLGFQVTARPPKGAAPTSTELNRWFEVPLPV